jgi:transposase
MNYTQNERIRQVTEKSLVIGIDIASEVQYARAFDWRGIELGKVFKFENRREGFERFSEWISKLKEQHKKNEIIAGAEPTGHYWFGLAGYMKESGIKLVLVNPFHVKRSKEFDDNNQSKTDSKDPKTIAKLVIDGRYMEPYIPEGIYADLRITNEVRLRISKEMNSIKNMVSRWLAIYFPEYREVFGDWSKKGSILIMKSIPLPEDVITKGKEGINQIWREEKLRAVGIKRASRLYEAASKSIGVKEGLQSARKELKILLEEYEMKEKQYEEVMKDLEEMCKQVPNAEKLLEIKGIGLVTVAGFIAEVGDINRFDSPKQIQKLAGLALRENSSGKHKGKTSISKRGRKRLRKLLFQVVMPLVAKNKEFGEIHSLYISREENPLKKKQSIVAISCRLIRIFYAILKKGPKYDSSKVMPMKKKEELGIEKAA